MTWRGVLGIARCFSESGGLALTTLETLAGDLCGARSDFTSGRRSLSTYARTSPLFHPPNIQTLKVRTADFCVVTAL